MRRSVAILVAVPLLAAWAWPKPPAIRLPHLPPPHAVEVPILEYHRVSTTVSGLPGLTVPPAQFAAEMEWLHRAGYHAVTQQQLYDALRFGLPLPRRPVAITFDDGYRDVLWNAAPVLHRLRMPATAYIITSRVDDGDPSFLSWGELARLERLGFAIGSHTVHHVPLAQVGDEEAWQELVGSRRALQRHLHRPVPWLSYPMGSADAHVAALARRAGYELAVTEQPGSLQTPGGRLLLRRDEVLPSTGVAGVAALVESARR
jgi:peptidoglycan/xylan/chitin deacetylase (PgdA/CDA1 family)